MQTTGKKVIPRVRGLTYAPCPYGHMNQHWGRVINLTEVLHTVVWLHIIGLTYDMCLYTYSQPWHESLTVFSAFTVLMPSPTVLTVLGHTSTRSVLHRVYDCGAQPQKDNKFLLVVYT